MSGVPPPSPLAVRSVLSGAPPPPRLSGGLAVSLQLVERFTADAHSQAVCAKAARKLVNPRALGRLSGHHLEQTGKIDDIFAETTLLIL